MMHSIRPDAETHITSTKTVFQPFERLIVSLAAVWQGVHTNSDPG